MKSVLFPHEFFDLPTVHDLAVEHKLPLAAACASALQRVRRNDADWSISHA